MICVDGNLIIPSRDIILFKVIVDLPGNRKPAERIGPQVAKVGLLLSGRIVRTGKRNGAVCFQRIIEFNHIAVGIREGRCECRCGQAEAQAERQQDTKDSFCCFHVFLPNQVFDIFSSSTALFKCKKASQLPLRGM